MYISSIEISIFEPVLELTHNHGTESDPDFSYHNGNDQDKGQVRGFGHVGFICDDLDAACAYLEEKGAIFKKKPQEGGMRGLAFVYDPNDNLKNLGSDSETYSEEEVINTHNKLKSAEMEIAKQLGNVTSI